MFIKRRFDYNERLRRNKQDTLIALNETCHIIQHDAIKSSPYADCPHPKSFSLREKDFPYRDSFSPLALRAMHYPHLFGEGDREKQSAFLVRKPPKRRLHRPVGMKQPGANTAEHGSILPLLAARGSIGYRNGVGYGSDSDACSSLNTAYFTPCSTPIRLVGNA